MSVINTVELLIVVSRSFCRGWLITHYVKYACHPDRSAIQRSRRTCFPAWNNADTLVLQPVLPPPHKGNSLLEPDYKNLFLLLDRRSVFSPRRH
jgi:hypothetical protein